MDTIKNNIKILKEYNLMTFRINEILFRSAHYPYATNQNDHHMNTCKIHYSQRRYGEILLHGHTHSKKRVNGKQINLCVDAWDFKPVSIETIYKISERVLNGKR